MKPQKKREARVAPAGSGCELAQVFRTYPQLLTGPMDAGTAKVVRDIVDCRTSRLGAHVRACSECGHEAISYNSCRNRHCPKCQFLARARWVDARLDELLPVEYFHVVFTVPHELARLIIQNKKELYAQLMNSSAATLKEVAKDRIRGEPGFIAVLHTWDQRLGAHPHVHMIVPGGGLRQNAEGADEWFSCRRGFLLPIAVLSRVFRGKFLSALELLRPKLQFQGTLKSSQDPRRFKKLLQAAARKEWIVYAKPPFAGPKQVIHYLGNYTHRVAISNSRILGIGHDGVRFRYRDSAHDNKSKVTSLPIPEFQRRFLLHVLPSRFVRIRHYGFLGNRFRKSKIARLKRVLLPETEEKEAAPQCTQPNWVERLKAITGEDLSRCPRCQEGEMRETRTIESYYDRRRSESRRKPWDTS